MLIRLPLTSLKGTYAHMKYYFTLLVLLYGKIQTFSRTKASDGWAANIFSSNTRCLKQQVETARAERKTVELRCIRVDERSAFQGEWSKKWYEVERHVKDDTSRGGTYTHPTYIWYCCHTVWRAVDTVDLFNRKWNQSDRMLGASLPCCYPRIYAKRIIAVTVVRPMWKWGTNLTKFYN